MNYGVFRAGLMVGALLAVASRSVAAGDTRLRSVQFDSTQIYALRGYVGYQIDLEFEPGERFLGIGAGDIDAVGYAAEGNHLFLKPRAARVHTNLTVLTTRRTYQFDYRVMSAAEPDRGDSDLVYSLRFTYPEDRAAARSTGATEAGERALDQAAVSAVNRNYWYCGSPGLRPLSAFDDGVETHVRFNPRGELPAIFVRNDDGSESLLNFSMHEGQMVLHRVAHRLVVRRGRLQGCIVNRSFSGVGSELSSGTIVPEVERATRGRADGQR